MLKMMMRPMPCSYSYRTTRGMLFLNSTSLVALLHSQSSNPSKCRETQLGNGSSNPRVSNVEDAVKVFDEMLHRRPLPSVVGFNQLLGQLAKLKHYSGVLSLIRQMGLTGIARDVCTLNIIINCYCPLNQMGFSLSILGQFFKLGLQPSVFTFNTLINGFVLKNPVAEAARLFSKMGRHCQPDVKQKLSQDNSKPTDSLTKTSISDSSSSRGKQNGSEDSKIIFKSPTVRLSVVKKPVVAKVNNLAKEDEKEVGEESKSLTKDEKEEDGKNKTDGGSNVLQSLFQNYNSDDSDE